MIIKRAFLKLWRGITFIPHWVLDSLFLRVDKANIIWTRNIRLIPRKKFRKGARTSYAEYGHVIGIFQTLIKQSLKSVNNVRILDIGCGTGLMGMASEPLLFEGGHYTGIDLIDNNVKYCKAHFDPKYFNFILSEATNSAYNPGGIVKKTKWDLKDNTFDLVTALSVWTHLDEDDAVFYLKEVKRVLKPGGRAIITFFFLNELYRAGIDQRVKRESFFHMTSPGKWVFDKPVYDSKNWFCPQWARVPESAIGINERGMDKLLKESGLEINSIMAGNWKEIPGVYFQDIIIFEKPKK